MSFAIVNWPCISKLKKNRTWHYFYLFKMNKKKSLSMLIFEKKILHTKLEIPQPNWCYWGVQFLNHLLTDVHVVACIISCQELWVQRVFSFTKLNTLIINRGLLKSLLFHNNELDKFNGEIVDKFPIFL